jgi:hypothetical protein
MLPSLHQKNLWEGGGGGDLGRLCAARYGLLKVSRHQLALIGSQATQTGVVQTGDVSDGKPIGMAFNFKVPVHLHARGAFCHFPAMYCGSEDWISGLLDDPTNSSSAALPSQIPRPVY